MLLANLFVSINNILHDYTPMMPATKAVVEKIFADKVPLGPGFRLNSALRLPLLGITWIGRPDLNPL
jgi:hypothetical protein